MTPRRAAIWAKWRGILREQKRSGQTVAAFCRERGLCAPHFFDWKKKIETAAAEKASGFVEVKVAAPVVEAASPGIEIVLAGERRVRVEAGFDRELLLAVVAALEGGR